MTRPNVGLIIQARTGSSRLPGKVLMDLEGKPVLERVVDRLKQIKNQDSVIVATSDLEKDDPIEALCSKKNISCYRGSEQDVLKRYVEAAKQYKLDVVGRITADCPLFDSGLADKMLSDYLADPVEYYSNINPRRFPRGLDFEVFTTEFMNKAYRERIAEDTPEYIVIPYLQRNISSVNTKHYVGDPDYSHMRWTLDEALDLELIRRIYHHFVQVEKSEDFSYLEIIQYLEANPAIAAINESVKQKSH